MLRTIRPATAPRALASIAWLALCASSATARPQSLDTTSPGFAIAVQRSVDPFSAYATLPDASRVVFDGFTVAHVADDGTLIQVLATLPGGVYRFPSFVLPDPTGAYALVGESSRGKIYRVDLAGAGAIIVADIEFNFDAVFEPSGKVLVSAVPCFMSGCGNQIWRVDVATGAVALAVSVNGYSGPVAISSAGDLYYATQPDSGGPGAILAWTRAQLDAGAVLDETSATTFVAALDPASSMDFDPVYRHLFVASPVYGVASQLLEYDSSGALVGSVVQGDMHSYISGVEFVDTPGPGSFQAFQPAGVEMRYRATDYFTSPYVSEIRAVHTKRPRAFTSGPGLTGPGPVTFTVRGAHPNASFRVIVGHSALYNPQESTYDAGTYLFHTGIPPSDIRRLGFITTDANGEGSFTFQNPGNQQGTLVLQGLIRNPNGDYIGSSTEAFN